MWAFYGIVKLTKINHYTTKEIFSLFLVPYYFCVLITSLGGMYIIVEFRNWKDFQNSQA